MVEDILNLEILNKDLDLKYIMLKIYFNRFEACELLSTYSYYI